MTAATGSDCPSSVAPHLDPSAYLISPQWKTRILNRETEKVQIFLPVSLCNPPVRSVMKNRPLLLLACAKSTWGFVNYPQRPQVASTSATNAGFGKDSGASAEQENNAKSYDDVALSPIKDLIDTESAMQFFFESNDEWKPLFQSMMSDSADAPATSFIEKDDSTDFEFHETTSPWKRLQAIPTQDDERDVLAHFLDNMQQSLLDIPVDERTAEDDNDVHFLEEGRRMLVCSRFHVIAEAEKGSITSQESLFMTCWNEIKHLAEENEADTGSLIVVPGYDIDDLRRFADMNLQRPLQWLGIDRKFEVASLQRGSPAIRLIHQLSDMPTDLPNEPETP